MSTKKVPIYLLFHYICISCNFKKYDYGTE